MGCAVFPVHLVASELTLQDLLSPGSQFRTSPNHQELCPHHQPPIYSLRHSSHLLGLRLGCQGRPSCVAATTSRSPEPPGPEPASVPGARGRRRATPAAAALCQARVPCPPTLVVAEPSRGHGCLLMAKGMQMEGGGPRGKVGRSRDRERRNREGGEGHGEPLAPGPAEGDGM